MIIDSAPLSEVVDALPLAASVDQVLLVVLLGRTQMRQMTELGELLAENGITPAGFAAARQPARRPRLLLRPGPAAAEARPAFGGGAPLGDRVSAATPAASRHG